ncbi:MAG: hypothetical protein NEHIOOID_00671 [Holosporales bacterium]
MDRTFIATIVFLGACFTILSAKAGERREDETCGSTMTTEKIEKRLHEISD